MSWARIPHEFAEAKRCETPQHSREAGPSSLKRMYPERDCGRQGQKGKLGPGIHALLMPNTGLYCTGGKDFLGRGVELDMN